MRKFAILFITLLFILPVYSVHAAYVEEEVPPQGEVFDDTPPEKRSGWFLGSDQGVLFFVGDSAQVLNAQYYGSLFGGYNIKGYIQPLVSLGQAIGSTSGFNSSTFWFIFEGGARFTPLRTKVRPFFSGTAGLYVLSVDTFPGILITSGANFTYSGGGGIAVSFGRSNLEVKGTYRGFRNSGGDLQGVAVTLGYFFQF
jgi:hypothetical protein